MPKASAVSCLNDYRPITLTSIVTKCFERLVMASIKKSINITTDSHQYAYRPNRSASITHLEKKNSYVRLLFLDFTSAFNIMILQTVVNKLSTLGLAPSLCKWVLDFLTNRPQSVRINNTISSTIILNTGIPQGCVLSPLIYTLLTHDCRAHCDSNLIEKFTDDTTVMGLVTSGDECRQEVDGLGLWCRENNLTLNGNETKEMIVDFRKNSTATPPPLHINGTAVEVVSSITLAYTSPTPSPDVKIL